MDRTIKTLYFSATDTTKKVVTGIAAKLCSSLNGKQPVSGIDFTLPAVREEALSFNREDVVVVGVPVYAGRVPNVLKKYLTSVSGNGALAIAIVVYGNRNYDDALIELTDILAADGFMVVAAGAFIGEHSFSTTLAKGRPDGDDLAIAAGFAGKIAAKILAGDPFKTLSVKGHTPYRNYYVPKKQTGEPVDIRKVTPKTSGACTDCKLCAQLCPMGSIDYDRPAILNGICIKCCACVKKCPTGAKYFDDANYLWHKEELELAFSSRREPELFV